MKRIVQYIQSSQMQKTVLCIVLLLLPALCLWAQSDPGADPDSAPIDGGLSILVAAGVGYGARKVKEKRNKKTTE